MTYHRWRKLYDEKHHHDPVGIETHVLVGRSVDQTTVADEKRIDDVRNENERLRRIVMDLLIEKAKVEEQLATVSHGKSLKRA